MSADNTKTKQVLVWEGEWTWVRLAARRVLNFIDSTKSTTSNLKSTAESHISEAKLAGEEQIKATKQTAQSVYNQYPLFVVAGVAGVFAFLTRRMPPVHRWRVAAAGTIVTSSLVLYPNHVATLITDPAAFVGEMFDSVQNKVAKE